MISKFLEVCADLGVPVSMEKTDWATKLIVFLGILLDGRNLILAVPEEKMLRAIELLNEILQAKKSKVTVKQLQRLCGFLNFLGKAIFPGRTFTRRMYAKYSHIVNIKGVDQVVHSHEYKWKQHHHIKIDKEFKLDSEVWLQFLLGDLQTVSCRPMVDLTKVDNSVEVGFYSDASASAKLGFGAIFGNRWIKGKWGQQFIADNHPSIEYLELFALTAGILTWQNELRDKRFCIHCDNTAVVQMINNLTSSCGNCMILIRLITLNGIKHNRRLTARYIASEANELSDALSRNQMEHFRKVGPHMNQDSDVISADIWLIDKIWKDMR